MSCYLCSISSSEKPKTPKKYCSKCKNKLKEYFLSFNESNEYLDLVKKTESYKLIRSKQAKPRSFDSITLLNGSDPSLKEDLSVFYVFLLENGVKEINQSEAVELVRNGWAEYVNEISIKMNIKRRTMIDEILTRDNHLCRFCQSVTDCTIFIEPEKDESIATPLNAICACPRCRTEYTKKDYFKWLNIEPLEMTEATVSLINHSKTKEYLIDRNTANILVNEHMARTIDDNSIEILYDRSTFRFLLKKKNKDKCYYCGKKGNTIDHVVPKSRGGMTTPDNCVWSCGTCNENKANMSEDEFKSEH